MRRDLADCPTESDLSLFMDRQLGARFRDSECCRALAELATQRRLVLDIEELDAEALGVVADDARAQVVVAEYDLHADWRPGGGVAYGCAGHRDVQELTLQDDPFSEL